MNEIVGNCWGAIDEVITKYEKEIEAFNKPPMEEEEEPRPSSAVNLTIKSLASSIGSLREIGNRMTLSKLDSKAVEDVRRRRRD